MKGKIFFEESWMLSLFYEIKFFKFKVSSFSESRMICKKLKFVKTMEAPLSNLGQGEPKCCITYFCWSKNLFFKF